MKPEELHAARLDDDAVARLIEGAGPRPPLPAEDLDAIAAVARTAWQTRRAAAGGRHRRDSLTAPAAAPPWRRVALALAASLLVVAIGLLAWRLGRSPGPAPQAVATIEGLTGHVELEKSGVLRPLVLGEQVPVDALIRTSGVVEAPGGQPARAALRLQNGSLVRLDAGSAVRLSAAARLDLLSGALYADTDPDAESAAGSRTAGADSAAALEIRTAIGTARDVGTRFMVRLEGEPDQPALQVLVRDGAVAVERDGESDRATAGELLSVSPDGRVERRAISPYGADWEWVMDAGPPFAVEGRTLVEILDWVARETGWTVRYEDEALEESARGIVVQGGGEAMRTLRADQAPFAVLPIANLEGKLENGVLVVRRPSG